MIDNIELAPLQNEILKAVDQTIPRTAVEIIERSGLDERQVLPALYRMVKNGTLINLNIENPNAGKRGAKPTCAGYIAAKQSSAEKRKPVNPAQVEKWCVAVTTEVTTSATEQEARRVAERMIAEGVAIDCIVIAKIQSRPQMNIKWGAV